MNNEFVRNYGKWVGRCIMAVCLITMFSVIGITVVTYKTHTNPIEVNLRIYNIYENFWRGTAQSRTRRMTREEKNAIKRERFKKQAPSSDNLEI